VSPGGGLAAASASAASAPARRRRPPVVAEIGTVHFDQNRVGSGAGPRRITVCLPPVREDPHAEDAWPPRKRSSAASTSAVAGPGAAPASLDEVEGSARADGADDDDEESLLPYKTTEHVVRSRKDSMVHALHAVRRSRSLRVRGRAAAPAPAVDPDLIFAHNEEPYFVPSLQAFSLDFSGRVTMPSNKNFLLKCALNPDSSTLVFGKIGVRGVAGAACDVYTLDFQWPLSPLQAFGIALASCDRKFFCA